MGDVYLQFDWHHSYYTDQAYPYRYYDVSPISGSVVDSGTITIQYTFRHYSSWSSPRIGKINFVELWFYDASGNLLDFEDASGYSSSSISGINGSTTINLSGCTNKYRTTAARVDVLIETLASVNTQSGTNEREVPVGNSYEQVPTFTLTHVSDVGAPSSPKVSETVSRSAVELSWGAGSAGTGNSVTGYDVQYRESSNGSSWGSWATCSGSPVAGTKLSVFPSDTVGHYRQYRVRTRGSAGESWYSGWVESTNTLRRKWAPFGAWTDAILTAGVSGIRAVHLNQLQERVGVIRAFYGLAAYSFTAIEARKTKIAKWAALIQEIRNAVDGITTSHEAWNTLQAGKPRIAHVTQLRKIIDALSGESETGAPYVFNINAYGHLLCSSNSSAVPPFTIDESGHLIYTDSTGEGLQLAINADGHLIMTTKE